jgi:hypothetical protein
MRLKWKLGSVGLEIVLLLMQDWCMVCVERTVGSKIVLRHPMELLADEGLVELCLVCLEIVLILTQDRCTVCTERTIGS